MFFLPNLCWQNGLGFKQVTIQQSICITLFEKMKKTFFTTTQ